MPMPSGGFRSVLIGAKIQNVQEEEQVAESEEVKDGRKAIQHRNMSFLIFYQKRR
jgi:hypothetical protein